MSVEARNSARQRVEQKILNGAIADTLRTIHHYASGLGYRTDEEFLARTAGKDICDVASGVGGLFKLFALTGHNARVVSVNPRVGLPLYTVFDEIETEKELSHFPKEKVSQLRLQYDQSVVPDFAHSLSLQNESFDLVFDNVGVSHYIDEEDALAFEDSITEMMRILRPGGELRIGDWTAYGKVENGTSDVPSFQEQTLINLGLDYELLWETNSLGVSEVIGVVVKKPLNN